MPDSNQQATPRLILIIGGARSGKSAFAERLAATSKQRVAFIATATASDPDMQARIAHHQTTRPSAWITIEEPLDLTGVVGHAALVADVLLLDCMTLWLANWLMQESSGNFDDPAYTTHLNDTALAEIERMLSFLDTLDASKTLLVVSNEVGLGIVPEYALSRAYRDILGRINQRLALHAERVYLLVAGLAVDIKRLHEEASL